jgi:hypothetical protein
MSGKRKMKNHTVYILHQRGPKFLYRKCRVINIYSKSAAAVYSGQAANCSTYGCILIQPLNAVKLSFIMTRSSTDKQNNRSHQISISNKN